jgi:hypothetical protein
MRQSRLSGSVEGVMGNHDSYSDFIVAASAGRSRSLSQPPIEPHHQSHRSSPALACPDCKRPASSPPGSPPQSKSRVCGLRPRRQLNIFAFYSSTAKAFARIIYLKECGPTDPVASPHEVKIYVYPPQPAATPTLQPALVLPPSAEASLAATERQLLDMQMKEAVREAVEEAVEKEIGRVEAHRKDVYRAYGLAFGVILAFIGITSWQQIPRVVASLIQKPASGQLAQVFQRGQDNANRLAEQSRIAQSKIDDLSLKLDQVQTELHVAKLLSQDLAGQARQSATAVETATATVERARKLQGELDTELASARETIASLKGDFAVTEKYVIEMEFLQYAGRNMFPNPYHQEIMNTLNKLVAVAIPNPAERGQFVKQLQDFTARTNSVTSKP